MTDSTDLSAWVQAAWGRHPQAPAEIAAALVAVFWRKRYLARSAGR